MSRVSRKGGRQGHYVNYVKRLPTYRVVIFGPSPDIYLMEPTHPILRLYDDLNITKLGGLSPCEEREESARCASKKDESIKVASNLLFSLAQKLKGEKHETYESLADQGPFQITGKPLRLSSCDSICQPGLLPDDDVGEALNGLTAVKLNALIARVEQFLL